MQGAIWNSVVAAAALVATSFAFASSTLYRLPYPDHHAYTITQASGGWISSHYTADSRHAVDIAMPEGTPVLAAREGVVSGVEWRHERGGRIGELWARSNYVRVRHVDGTIGVYAHLAHVGVAVEPGEPVRAGQVLGYSGATGFVSGPHLHFAVTREQRAGTDVEEVSEPVMFYVGNPPIAFAPRVGLAVTANYSGPASPPAPPRLSRQPAFMPQGNAIEAGLRWLIALALMAGGMAWFYRFSRS